ncbi:hypothetical protein BpHYR1_011173 [Brachionus plicatilis]|uniref:Uncharacterized protein n=1 Tax=Brachionus plicatilis TaxID=10195 RepID=A0A3M7T7E0_BRAPC|nr:hypothetical protein BpHYR1_011173 [Brachionus plicatilis]
MGTLLHLVGEDEFDLSDREIEEMKLILKEKLAEIINILEPFEFVTNGIQGDQYSTISLVVPSLLQLIQHLDDFKLVNNSLKAFISELRNETNTRFSEQKQSRLFMHLFIKRLEDQLFQKWKINANREENENNIENQIPCTSNDATKNLGR